MGEREKESRDTTSSSGVANFGSTSRAPLAPASQEQRLDLGGVGWGWGGA